MMRMHGLGPVAFWSITYAYHVLAHVVFYTVLYIAGTLLGNGIFRDNSVSLQVGLVRAGSAGLAHGWAGETAKMVKCEQSAPGEALREQI